MVHPNVTSRRAQSLAQSYLHCSAHNQPFTENPYRREYRGGYHTPPEIRPLVCPACVKEARAKVQLELRRHRFGFVQELLQFPHRFYRSWLMKRLSLDFTRRMDFKGRTRIPNHGGEFP